MKALTDLIKKRLRENTNDETKKFWSKYLKGEIEFIGIGIPQIKNLLIEIISSKTFTVDELKTISYELMQSKISEEKLAAILLMQLFILYSEKDTELLYFINKLFDEKLIFDWNTCDWLSVRIITPIIDNKNRDAILLVEKWKDKKYLWYARASLVPFTQAKSLNEHMDYINTAANQLIKREERFVKTAVGWVLREVSKFNTQYVKKFLEINVNYLTLEVINNSLKYFTNNDKTEIKKSLKI